MNDINLVPVSYKKSLRRKWYIGFGVVGGVVVFITMIAVALIPGYKIREQEQERMLLDRELAKEELVEVKEVLEEIDWLKGSRKYLTDIIEEIDVPKHVTRKTMDNMASNIPQGLYIDDISVNPSDNSVIIAGMADNSLKIVDYIMKLYNTGYYTNITYVYNPAGDDDLKRQGWVEYNMQVKLSNTIENEENVEGEVQEQQEDEDGGEESL